MLPAVPCWENFPSVKQKSFDISIVAGCGILDNNLPKYSMIMKHEMITKKENNLTYLL